MLLLRECSSNLKALQYCFNTVFFVEVKNAVEREKRMKQAYSFREIVQTMEESPAE